MLDEPAGPVTHTAPFIADSTAPTADARLSARALEFRVTEPGTVTLTVRGTPWRRYVKTVEKAGLVSFWISSPQPTRVHRDGDGRGRQHEHRRSPPLAAAVDLRAMQPPLRRSRPIGQPLRPDLPLRYERLSDPILVRRAKDGDDKALAALCERHAPAVERLARQVLRNPEDARDAAQESLAKLCRRIRQFRGESQFSTWLHRLVVEHLPGRGRAERRARLRAAARGSPARAATATRCRPPPPRSFAPSSARRLAGISPVQAQVVVLKDVMDSRSRRSPRPPDLPVGTAKSYAHRGRRRLRESIERGAA